MCTEGKIRDIRYILNEVVRLNLGPRLVVYIVRVSAVSIFWHNKGLLQWMGKLNWEEITRMDTCPGGCLSEVCFILNCISSMFLFQKDMITSGKRIFLIEFKNRVVFYTGCLE